jgi:hypothetical protein
MVRFSLCQCDSARHVWLHVCLAQKMLLRIPHALPTRPGLGVSLSEQVKAWTAEEVEIGKRA